MPYRRVGKATLLCRHRQLHGLAACDNGRVLALFGQNWGRGRRSSRACVGPAREARWEKKRGCQGHPLASRRPCLHGLSGARRRRGWEPQSVDLRAPRAARVTHRRCQVVPRIMNTFDGDRADEWRQRDNVLGSALLHARPIASVRASHGTEGLDLVGRPIANNAQERRRVLGPGARAMRATGCRLARRPVVRVWPA